MKLDLCKLNFNNAMAMTFYHKERNPSTKINSNLTGANLCHEHKHIICTLHLSIVIQIQDHKVTHSKRR